MAYSYPEDFVQLRNGPNSPYFHIPATVADLLKETLGLSTRGHATHGLRWESDGTGVIFLENIKPSTVHIYVLPTSLSSWRNPDALKTILRKEDFPSLCERVSTARNGKDLRIRNLSWSQAYSILPTLVRWSFTSRTGRDFVTAKT